VTPPPDPDGDDESGPFDLSNLGGPDATSRHPNGEDGHRIPTGHDPHCILVYNMGFTRPVTIVSVTFTPGPSKEGGPEPLRYASSNSDQNCGWLHGNYSAPKTLRKPVCVGVTLPPLPPGDPFQAKGCVLRVNKPDPDSTVNRKGHFTFTYRMRCISRENWPCTELKPSVTPTVENPVKVTWTPELFWVAACGSDATTETDDQAANKGHCPKDEPPSTAPTTPSNTTVGTLDSPSP